MADRAGQLTHLSIDLESLIGESQVPEGHRQMAAVGDSRIRAGVGGPVSLILRVVVLVHGHCESVVGAGEISTIQHRLTHPLQGFHHNAAVAEPVGKFHPLVGQLRAPPKIAASEVKHPASKHAGEYLRRLTHPLAQLTCPREDGADSVGGVTARRDVGGARARTIASSRASRSGDSSRVSSSPNPGTGGRSLRSPPTVPATATRP